MGLFSKLFRYEPETTTKAMPVIPVRKDEEPNPEEHKAGLQEP